MTGEKAGRDGRITQQPAARSHKVRDAALGAYGHSVAYSDVPGKAYLSAYHAIMTQTCRTCDPCLGSYDGVGADFDIVCHLHVP